MPGVSEVICRVISSADGLDVELADEALAAEFRCGELGVAFLENLPGRGRGEGLVDSEGSHELDVGPMVERGPHRVRHRLSPLLEFLPGRSVSGDVFLCNKGGARRLRKTVRG